MSKNAELLDDFVKYCHKHPEYRFWQALRNWCGWPFVFVSDRPPFEEGFDTFYWDGKKSAQPPATAEEKKGK